MPDISNPLVERDSRGYASARFVDVSGNSMTFSIYTDGGEVNGSDHETLFRDIANLSNACLVRFDKSKKEEWYPSDWYGFDEAFASVSDQVVLVFTKEGNVGSRQEIIIPAPDAAIFLSDGVTLDLTNQNIIDIIDKAREIMSDDGDPLTTDLTWRFERAYFTTRKGLKRRRGVNAVRPELREPGVGDDPGDSPATGGL